MTVPVLVLIPLVVAIVGYVLMIFTTAGNAKELGKALLWCGLFFTLYAVLVFSRGGRLLP